ncbi:hypothetical protein ZWY2020_011408 [Hordeum vulgare]|nr:hypothetical protein ZWY2020_011408 [Hordeum vulgare]
MKATVSVHMKSFWWSDEKKDRARDWAYDLILGSWLTLELVSSELDPSETFLPSYYCVCSPSSKFVYVENGLKSYIPSQTPKGVEKLRKSELEALRGNGCGERKKHDRIYDYDVYNDLGKPESKRPVLGGKEHPYPRRCRTGRPRSKTDPSSEEESHKKGEMYVPRDETFTERKEQAFLTKQLLSQLHGLCTGLKVNKDILPSFRTLASIDALCDGDFRNQPVQPEGARSGSSWICLPRSWFIWLSSKAEFVEGYVESSSSNPEIHDSRRSTDLHECVDEGFQSVPYVVALFSAMLWIYYALLKSDRCLLITINSAGCVIETIYIIVYLTYAPKQAKLFTAKILLLLNVGVFGLILLLTCSCRRVRSDIVMLGWVCVGFSVSVFVAPLSVILQRLVVRTRAWSYALLLSLSLTVSAVVCCPTFLGSPSGVIQMGLYAFYRNATPTPASKQVDGDDAVKSTRAHVVDIAKLSPAPGCRRAQHTLPVEPGMPPPMKENAKTGIEATRPPGEH